MEITLRQKTELDYITDPLAFPEIDEFISCNNPKILSSETVKISEVLGYLFMYLKKKSFEKLSVWISEWK